MRSQPLTGWDPLRDTGSPLDLALLGNANAFFVVRTPEGELCCTRQGSFTLDGNRRLVTTSGCAVLGISNGQLVEIYLPGGTAGERQWTADRGYKQPGRGCGTPGFGGDPCRTGSAENR